MHEARRRAVVRRQHRLTTERGATPPLFLARDGTLPTLGGSQQDVAASSRHLASVSVEPAIRRREASRSAGKARSIARRGSPGRRPRSIAYYPEADVRSEGFARAHRAERELAPLRSIEGTCRTALAAEPFGDPELRASAHRCPRTRCASSEPRRPRMRPCASAHRAERRTRTERVSVRTARPP
jgi:hypothetical protein